MYLQQNWRQTHKLYEWAAVGGGGVAQMYGILSILQETK